MNESEFGRGGRGEDEEKSRLLGGYVGEQTMNFLCSI